MTGLSHQPFAIAADATAIALEPERLVLEEAAEDSWLDGAVSEVRLIELADGRTEMRFRATIHTTEEMIGIAETGINSGFDRLAEQVAAR